MDLTRRSLIGGLLAAPAAVALPFLPKAAAAVLPLASEPAPVLLGVHRIAVPYGPAEVSTWGNGYSLAHCIRDKVAEHIAAGRADAALVPRWMRPA